MKKENLSFENGLVELTVNGGRTIRLNPSDAGFAETLYELVARLSSIHEEKEQTWEAEEDIAARFAADRAEDAAMREAVDAIFGEGFCADVFPGMRLFALAEGLTVVENFIFSLLDRMDEGITDNLTKREGRIAKYTARYRKYQKYAK